MRLSELSSHPSVVSWCSIPGDVWSSWTWISSPANLQGRQASMLRKHYRIWSTNFGYACHNSLGMPPPVEQEPTVISDTSATMLRLVCTDSIATKPRAQNVTLRTKTDALKNSTLIKNKEPHVRAQRQEVTTGVQLHPFLQQPLYKWRGTFLHTYWRRLARREICTRPGPSLCRRTC